MDIGSDPLTEAYRSKGIRLNSPTPGKVLFAKIPTSSLPAGYSTFVVPTGVTTGSHYFEATVDLSEPNSDARIGWTSRRTRLDCPLGCDAFSFGLRVSDLACVSQGHPRPQYGGSFEHSDRLGSSSSKTRIGCRIDLPEANALATTELLTSLTASAGSVIQDEKFLLFDPESGADIDHTLNQLDSSSSVTWYVNGTPLGPAYSYILAGSYYPAISIYGKAKGELFLDGAVAGLLQGCQACKWSDAQSRQKRILPFPKGMQTRVGLYNSIVH